MGVLFCQKSTEGFNGAGGVVGALHFPETRRGLDGWTRVARRAERFVARLEHCNFNFLKNI